MQTRLNTQFNEIIDQYQEVIKEDFANLKLKVYLGKTKA